MLENEQKLVSRAKQGEAASFGVLYDYYASQLYRFIYLKVSEKSQAQDILHEVFLSAWKNIKIYQDQGLPFSSWLYQIARNRIIDFYRSRKNNLSLDEVATAETKLGLVTAPEIFIVEQRLALTQIRKALRQLSEEQQNIIILRFINDLAPVEIAAALGKSEGAVRLLQHRALQKLRKILNNHET